jgi:hypothetical protein
MTTLRYEPSATGDVPWNGDREKRVLGGALRSWRRRERQKRRLEILAVVGGILMVVRFLPRPPMETDGTGGALGASAAERVPAYVEPRSERAPAIALPNDLATRTGTPASGFSGTGGHGGGGHGIGGGAGTG